MVLGGQMTQNLRQLGRAELARSAGAVAVLGQAHLVRFHEVDGIGLVARRGQRSLAVTRFTRGRSVSHRSRLSTNSSAPRPKRPSPPAEV